jgi:hypothetical protein
MSREEQSLRQRRADCDDSSLFVIVTQLLRALQRAGINVRRNESIGILATQL